MLGLLLAVVFVLVYRRSRGHAALDLAPTADGGHIRQARARRQKPSRRARMRPHDAALDFAWSTAASIEPRVEGSSFFPRILADVEEAVVRAHPDVRMARRRDRHADGSPRAKLEEGVEVRVIVDRYGSRPYADAREMFTRLGSGGAQIVVNDVFPLDRDGLFPDDQHFDWRQDEVGRADHRKLYRRRRDAWTGGAGIEDHWDGGFQRAWPVSRATSCARHSRPS